MRGLPPVTIRTAERRFRSGPNLLSDLKILAVDGLAPKWFSSSTTQDSMGIEWMTVIYQRPDLTAYSARGSDSSRTIRFGRPSKKESHQSAFDPIEVLQLKE